MGKVGAVLCVEHDGSHGSDQMRLRGTTTQGSEVHAQS